MAKKPHVKINSTAQYEKSQTMKFNYGYGGEGDEEKKEDPNYLPMADSFRTSLEKFDQDTERRIYERNEELAIPAHINYIQIEFQDQFNLAEYYQSYYKAFGLTGVSFSKFNREVLFAIDNQDKFSSFIDDINAFIVKETGEDEEAEYRANVKYIKSFKLLTTEDILRFQDKNELVNFQIIDIPGGSAKADTVYRNLEEYLGEHGTRFRLIEETNILEVFGASTEQITEIVKNFDILSSVTSSYSSVVRPTELNTVERDYGFTISNPEADLPIVGILDTGISNTTPLAPLIVEDNQFNLTNTSPFVDNANEGYGHGTAVAALTTLGNKPYESEYRGEIEADARLLSIKILDGNSGHLSMLDVLDQLRNAKKQYPEIKIFVLTTCYEIHKSTNESFSAYAFELDKFAYENDCLVFICTANNDDASNLPGYDLGYFEGQETNLCSPADSMNNIIVGAAADNINSGVFYGISNGREFPALYTRKSHIDLEQFKKPNKRFTKNNPNLFRPDVIESAGDFEQAEGFIAVGDNASLQVLSANPAIGFIKEVGTSFATPLVANIAAQIQSTYPSLRAQTIKALILNAASLDTIPFDNQYDKLQNKTAGHGKVNELRTLTSNDNSISFVLEDEIGLDEMKIIPIHFPAYLTEDDLGKKVGLLKLKATLCFSFDPVHNNQLGYCPLRMAFKFCRNHSGEDILKSANEEKGGIDSNFKSGWTQDNRWIEKPIPPSNSQKLQIPISVKDLIDEDSTLKLAIHCRINPQLLVDDKYKSTHKFSLAITMEENLPDARQTGKLYAEMIAINEIETILHVEGEADADAQIVS